MSLALVENEYLYYKSQIRLNLAAKNYQAAIEYISAAAFHAYSYNYLFSDPQLEEAILEISKSCLKRIDGASETEWVLFYDNFGWLNRGLTQQYMNALIRTGSKVIYILSPVASVDDSKHLLDQYRSEDNVQVYCLDSSSLPIARAKALENILLTYQPSKCFLHTSPWEVASLLALNQYTHGQKILINLTDHAFWLGSSVLDLCVEFRSFGSYVSRSFRGLTQEQIVSIPYYPVPSKSDFLGFPFNLERKIIGFAGAAYNKVLGRDNRFFRLISEALSNNPSLVVLFAGDGDRQLLKRILRESGINERFYLLGNRPDISEIFKRIDIYINTYPVIGGLMTQYAAINGKPIVTFSEPGLAYNAVDDFLGVPKTTCQSYGSESEFIDELRKLVNNEGYRTERGRRLLGAVPTQEAFEAALKDLLASPTRGATLVPNDDVEFDHQLLRQVHFESVTANLGEMEYRKARILGSKYLELLKQRGIRSSTKALNAVAKYVFTRIFVRLFRKPEQLWPRLLKKHSNIFRF